MENDDQVFVPGERILVYDYSQFKNDRDTPAKTLYKAAKVSQWYGTQKTVYYSYDDYGNRYEEFSLGPYPSMVDVVFEHNGKESHGHFTYGVYKLKENVNV